VTDPAFLTRIAEENDLRFLFDLSHAHIAAANRGTSYANYVAGLPLERISQVHLSGHRIEADGHALDAHDAPPDAMLAEAKELVSRFPLLQYATIEYYRDAPTLLDAITRLRRLFGLPHA